MSQLSTLESMVAAGLAKGSTPTPPRIRELIKQVRSLPMFHDVSDNDAERLALEFETKFGHR
jgi:hypothetical protein